MIINNHPVNKIIINQQKTIPLIPNFITFKKSIMIQFEAPKDKSSIIKVLGVGGGGGNAVNHMFNQGIAGVDFLLCNTDAQALNNSPIPNKIHIGQNITEGLGAGANPEVGRNAAIEETDVIREALSHNTRMLFITAGMGGGTGTGAAPIIAEIAKELDILTIAIVTIPFGFEGRKRKQVAEAGIEALKQFVDAIIVINNEKIIELYGDLDIDEAFAHADNILATGAKGIAELISVHRKMNLDFEDVKTVMRNSGIALMGNGLASGENRAAKAAEMAINSPLLDENDIRHSKRALLNISYSSEHKAGIMELNEVTRFMTDKLGNNVDIIFGSGVDDNLGENISVTLIATGFRTKIEREKEDNRQVLTLNSEHKTLSSEELRQQANHKLKSEPTIKNPVHFNPQIGLFDNMPETYSDNTNVVEETMPENNTQQMVQETPEVSVQPTPSVRPNVAPAANTTAYQPQVQEIPKSNTPEASIVKTDAQGSSEFVFTLSPDTNTQTTNTQIETATDVLEETPQVATPVSTQPATEATVVTPNTETKISGNLEERIKQLQAISSGRHSKATQKENTVSSDTKEAPMFNMKNNEGHISIERTPNGYINKNAD